jgi:hypothetical protein
MIAKLNVLSPTENGNTPDVKKSQLTTKRSKRLLALLAMMAGRAKQLPCTSMGNEDTEQSHYTRRVASFTPS